MPKKSRAIEVGDGSYSGLEAAVYQKKQEVGGKGEVRNPRSLGKILKKQRDKYEQEEKTEESWLEVSETQQN